MELELSLLARQPGLRKAGHLMRSGDEATVTAPPTSSPRNDNAGAGVGEVGNEIAVGVEHLRSHRHAEDDVLTRGAVLPRASAGATAPGDVSLAGAIPGEIAQILVGEEHDVSATAAVAAVRSAARDVLLATEAERAVASAPRPCGNADAILKHCGLAD